MKARLPQAEKIRDGFIRGRFRLSPLAACGLMLFMAGAATTRFRRGEWAYMAGDISFILAFAFIAWGRFALAPYA